MKSISRRVAAIGVLVAGALLVTACAAITPVSQPAVRYAPAARSGPARPAGQLSDARRLAELVNRHRVSRGLAPLAWSPRAARVAMAHSQDMVRRRFFSHENPDGRSPFDRMRTAGIEFRAAGENIAGGQTTPRQAFEGWIRSRGHRENIESPMFTHQGIAVHRNHWTQVLLNPR